MQFKLKFIHFNLLLSWQPQRYKRSLFSSVFISFRVSHSLNHRFSTLFCHIMSFHSSACLSQHLPSSCLLPAVYTMRPLFPQSFPRKQQKRMSVTQNSHKHTHRSFHSTTFSLTTCTHHTSIHLEHSNRAQDKAPNENWPQVKCLCWITVCHWMIHWKHLTTSIEYKAWNCHKILLL